VENCYDRGTCKLGGRNWQYISLFFDTSGDRATKRFATEQGYIIPQCFLAKQFSKVYGPKNNYLVSIAYVEEPPTSDYACHLWKPNSEEANSGLEYSQREYIEQFQKNAETSFKILELGGQKLSKTDLQQELEKESLKIASVPEGKAKMPLRTEPKKLSEKDIRKMLARYDFYDDDLNWRGSFTNDFVDNGDGTITDRATGLMWQKGGGSMSKTLGRAKFYVKKLNQNRFTGHSDWRLPTIEEFASLLESHETNGRHIDSLFDQKQARCWSSDKGPKFGGWTSTPPQAWYVNFPAGTIDLQVVTRRDGQHVAFTSHIYVRAVRSLR
jgi:hypothetical protein